MKNSQAGSSVLWLIIILVVLAVVGVLYYSKNKPASTDDVQMARNIESNGSIPEYVFSVNTPSKLTEIILSVIKVQVDSPWGAETNRKGDVDGSVAWYTFSNGMRILVELNKLNPEQELNQLKLSSSEKGAYSSVYEFVSSKIGPNFSSYDYELFLHSTTQETVDNAISKEDKNGYLKVLALKDTTSFSPSDIVYSFSNPYGKGFAWVPSGSEVPSAIDFWGTNGWMYRFAFPDKKNTTKVEIDAFIRSINPNL